MSLNMFRASPRPSSEAYNCINSLWFYRWSVGGSSVVGRGLAGRPVSQVYYLTFMCRSTCFGRLHAHLQELTTAVAASGFTSERGGISFVV